MRAVCSALSTTLVAAVKGSMCCGGHQRAQGRCVGHGAGPHTESVLDAEV